MTKGGNRETAGLEALASYRRTIERIRANWPAFLEKRRARLAQE